MIQLPEFLQKIDWSLLREQKIKLIDISMDEYLLNKEVIVAVKGIIELIDAIQDYAVDDIGLTNKEVFDIND